MFVNDRCLRHLLQPEHYCSPLHLSNEIDGLFRPGWHLVATKEQLPKDGDYITLSLFGSPLLIRYSGGKYFAYENTCPHRHSMLSSQPTGNLPTLRCQYHGWEFADSGCTAKIPDARCFRPWDRDNSRLNRYRLESCGDLLFVCLQDEGPCLAEFLDPYYAEFKNRFVSPLWKMRYVWEFESECNWKVPIENTLESYHIQAIHQKTFGDFFPTEASSDHVLHDRYSALKYCEKGPPESAQARASRWLGRTPTHEYLHRHIFPNHVLAMTDTFNYCVTYLPLSPTRVRVRIWMFALRGTRRDPFSAAASWIAWRIGKRKSMSIFNEDRDIYVDQQKGLQSSRHPGVIGTREERIFAFQSYIKNRLDLKLPPDPADTAIPMTMDFSRSSPSVPR